MREVLAWPNVERELRFWLVAHLDVSRAVYSETTTKVPPRYVTVERAGGRGDGPLDKRVAVEIGVHTDGTRDDMWDMARDVESAMAALAANGTPGMYVDEVDETFAFANDPPPDPSRRRAIATYTLTVRPR